MNTSSRNILAGLTLVAAGIAVGWGVAQWRAGHLSGSPAANVCWRALKTDPVGQFWMRANSVRHFRALPHHLATVECAGESPLEYLAQTSQVRACLAAAGCPR